MSDTRRFYWLKLHKDFFKSKRIKKLRKLAGGDTFTIIYLKMQLLALTNEGYIEYTGLENTFEEELALDIDEDVENVKITVAYLLSCNLMSTEDGKDYFLPYVAENIGSETASAERMRNMRKRERASLCYTGVTEALQTCDVEIEKEKEIEIDINKKSKKFIPPTAEEVKAYCEERNNNIDAEEFVDFYTSKGWMVGKNKMKDWKASVRTWERNNKKGVKTDDSRVPGPTESDEEYDKALDDYVARWRRGEIEEEPLC